MSFPFENGILKKYLFSMLHFLFDKPLCFEYNKVTLYFSRNGGFMYIRRHLEEQVKLASKNYPVIMVCGQRQVGKSTMLNHIKETERKYVTLDDINARRLAETDRRREKGKGRRGAGVIKKERGKE